MKHNRKIEPDIELFTVTPVFAINCTRDQRKTDMATILFVRVKSDLIQRIRTSIT